MCNYLLQLVLMYEYDVGYWLLYPSKSNIIKTIVPNFGWLKLPTKKTVFGEVPYFFKGRLGLLGIFTPKRN